MEYNSWVRDRIKTRLNLSSKSAKISCKADKMGGDPFNYLMFSLDDIASSVDNLFGGQAKAIEALGQLGYQQLILCIDDQMFSGALEKLIAVWSAENEDDAKLRDWEVTLGVIPSLIEIRDICTDRTVKRFNPFFFLDMGNVQVPTRGLYSKNLSLALIDTSGDENGIPQMFHEFCHYWIQSLRDSGLDDMMYDSDANRREEIIVHSITDLFAMFEAMREMTSKARIYRNDETGAMKQLVMPMVSVDFSGDSRGIGDRLVRGNDVKIFSEKSTVSNREFEWLGSISSHPLKDWKKSISAGMHQSKSQVFDLISSILESSSGRSWKYHDIVSARLTRCKNHLIKR